MSESKPKISIIMPVYNAEIYLKDAIEDVLYQTFTDFELICVDDGSTDSSPKVLEYFANQDERLRIIRQENKGAGAARNAGLDAATGEYLLFLDADDRFMDTLLEKTVRKAESVSADIVIYDAECFDAHTYLNTDSEWILKKEYLPSKSAFTYLDCPERIFNISASGTWNKLFRTEFIRCGGIRFMNTPYMNDAFFVQTAMVSAAGICVLDSKLMHYRVGVDKSVTSTDNRKIYPYCPYEVLYEIKRKTIELGIYDNVWKSLANYAVQHLFWIEDTLEFEEFVTYFSKVKEEYLDTFRINELTRDDYISTEYYERVIALNRYGVEGLLYVCMKHQGRMVRDRIYENMQFKNKSAVGEAFCFHISGIPKGKTIALYGAGYQGRKLYEMIRKTGAYKIALWIDSNYGNITDLEYIISPPAEIANAKYDYLVIAVNNIAVAQDIMNSLNGIVDREKIVW